MRFENFSFGSIRIDGVTYEHDVVIDRGEVRKRRKKASKRYRDGYGHNSQWRPRHYDQAQPTEQVMLYRTRERSGSFGGSGHWTPRAQHGVRQSVSSS